MAVEAFGTDREDIRGQRFEKYRGKQNKTDRAAILYKDPKKLFRGAKVHIKKGEKIFLCKSTKEKKEICCTHSYEGRDPVYHIGCALLLYDLIEKDGKMKLRGYEVWPWTFWPKMYQKLITADKEFPLAEHDVKLICTNEDWQTIDVQSCRESIWVSNEGLKKKVLEEAEKVWEDISKNLGSDMSLSEIKELLSIEDGGVDDAAADVDLGQVVGSIE